MASCTTCENTQLEPHLHVSPLNFSTQIREGTILRCPQCDTFVLDPFPSENDIREIYEVEQVFSNQPKNRYADRLFYKQFERLYQLYGDDRYFIVRNTLRRCGSKIPRVLDIGCSTGSLLERFHEVVPESELVGIDMDPGARERAPTWLRDAIHTGTVETVGNIGKFDIITMRFVVEHLPDPRATLKTVRNLLREGGCLMVSCPDIGSKKASILGAKWPLVTDPNNKIGHCVWYTERSLRRLLESAGFQLKFIRNRGEIYFDLPQKVGLVLEKIFGREPGSGRFIRWYQPRILWAVLADGFLSEMMGWGDCVFSFSSKKN